MRAIVNVKLGSSYSHHNGLTYEVVDILTKIVALDINGKTVDFSHREVMVVDIQKEMQKAYDDYNWDSSRASTYNNLVRFVNANNMVCPTVEYNCPS